MTATENQRRAGRPPLRSSITTVLPEKGAFGVPARSAVAGESRPDINADWRQLQTSLRTAGIHRYVAIIVIAWAGWPEKLEWVLLKRLQPVVNAQLEARIQPALDGRSFQFERSSS